MVAVVAIRARWIWVVRTRAYICRSKRASPTAMRRLTPLAQKRGSRPSDVYRNLYTNWQHIYIVRLLALSL